MQVTNIISSDPSAAGRYLADQLSEAERNVFEAYLRDNPRALKELEATARLKVGLQMLRETGELSALLRSSPAAGKRGVFALVATVAALVVGIGVFRWSQELAEPMLAASLSAFADRAGHGLSVGATQAVFRKRAEGYDATIELPAPGQAVELRILPETRAPTARYRIELAQIRDDNTIVPVATVSELQPAADGFVTVFVDAARWAPGRYRLAVSGGGADGALAMADRFVIKVVSRPMN